MLNYTMFANSDKTEFEIIFDTSMYLPSEVNVSYNMNELRVSACPEDRNAKPESKSVKPDPIHETIFIKDESELFAFPLKFGNIDVRAKFDDRLFLHVFVTGDYENKSIMRTVDIE